MSQMHGRSNSYVCRLDAAGHKTLLGAVNSHEQGGHRYMFTSSSLVGIRSERLLRPVP